MLVISILFILTCLNPKKMLIFCTIESNKKRNSRLNNSGNQDFTSFIKYILYPRLEDFQKGSLIIIGYLAGFFLVPSTFSMIDLKKIIITWFVIEFLGYQARYQINDLRGIFEDSSNRLPVPEKFAPLSSIIALVRLLIAFIVTALLGGDTTFSLIVCLVVLLLLTYAYEYVRTQYNHTLQNYWCVFILILVSLGYPLRFIAGFWAAIPTFWGANFLICGYELSIVEKFLILLAFAFFGEFSVLFAWYSKANEQNIDGTIRKKYYSWLLQHHTVPLRSISFVISIVILLFLQLQNSSNPIIVFFEIGIVICTILVCLVPNPLLAALASSIILIVIGLWKWSSLYYILLDSSYTCFIFFTQIFFLFTYVSAKMIFGPKIDLKATLKNISTHICYTLAGKKSIEWLESKANDKDNSQC